MNSPHKDRVLLGSFKEAERENPEKRPKKWADNSFLLHHNKAPVHRAHAVKEFLAKTKITVLSHPSYSSDLAPCDYFLFPKLKVESYAV